MTGNSNGKGASGRGRAAGGRVARRALVPLAQGAFYTASGLWPILHLRSFEAVTGPKRDRWLVRTLGGLIAAVGATLVAEGLEAEDRAPARVLGVASALALGGASAYYALRGRISRIYLADAAVEAAIAAAWLVRRPG
jgi:hypothetical protein